jgi:hypothetical protein
VMRSIFGLRTWSTHLTPSTLTMERLALASPVLAPD